MRHVKPVMISRAEIESAFKVLAENPSAKAIAFFDYEQLGGAPPPKTSDIGLELGKLLDGSHPMFNGDFVQRKLEEIKLECEKFGINTNGKKMHEVLTELNIKRKTAQLGAKGDEPKG